MRRSWVALVFLLSSPGFSSDQIVVGSKIFTESYILGEIAAQTSETASTLPVVRRLGLGNTGILFESLRSGSVDVYPDYTGTLAEAILKRPGLRSLEEIRAALLPLGLTISGSLGFNDSYALAVREVFAEKYGLHSISDLVQIESKIRAAFSYEFMDRQDGYRGMVSRYRLDFKDVERMEHSLVYRAIADGAVDLIEVYSTDANIEKFKLRVLRDDLSYFPPYQAVWVARTEFVREQPNVWKSLERQVGAISGGKMIAMNADADIRKVSFDQIASRYLGKGGRASESELRQISQRTKEHLGLVGSAMLFSILVGIPFGVLAVRFRLAGQGILLLSALFQTIPSLALLCFLIPLFGIGAKPALVALCLYSLLPVVLNTFTGISSIDPRHLENARAFGLSRSQILFRVVLPMASPTLLAGVKTATIVSIGTATLAALIGAGGYGASIVSGLALNNIRTILMGAVPAALMALAAHLAFEGMGILLVPRGLRKRAAHQNSI